MSCSPFDIRDYYLQELTDPQRRQVEAHVQDCAACREELDQLRLTQAALFSLRDEEIPQRIAFVSDPVFLPSGARRWWAAFWTSSARLGFAAAVLLSAGLVFATLNTTHAGGGLSAAQVDRRIQQAVAASEARQTQTTTKLVHDLVERVDSERNLRLAAEDEAKRAQEEFFAMEKSIGGLVTQQASN